MFSDYLFALPGMLLAQAEGRGWVDLLMEIDPGRLVLMAVFGTGFVSAVGYALASIIRAANSAPEDNEELEQRVAELEARIRQLEKREPETVGYRS